MNGTPDIEYKQEDTDTAGLQIEDANGIGINLGAYTSSVVTLIMKLGLLRYIVPCDEGGWVDGDYFPYSEGGITPKFTPESTSIEGSFMAECVIAWVDGEGNDCKISAPSGNNYLTVKIWPRL